MPAYDAEHFSPAAPVATVRLSHPDHEGRTADVLMLIDTGADATLLPKWAVTSLGLAGTGERYEIMAFDGSIQYSEAYRAVLVWLNKSFRGRFLPIDAEVGILGRNILNGVRLLLDGPAKNWGEGASPGGHS